MRKILAYPAKLFAYVLNGGKLNDQMDAIDIFPWIDNFDTGIPIIDEQHKKLVQLLNQLASHLVFNSNIVQSNVILEELADYAVYHFETEEAIWDEYFGKDILLTGHKAIHNSFVSTVSELKSHQANSLLENVLKFLTDWLASHILQNDRYMALVVLSIQSGIPIDSAKKHADEQIAGATRILTGIILSIYNKFSSNTLELIRENAARRQLSHALLESQTQLKAVIDSTSDLIWSVDAEHFGLMMFNRELANYFKRQRSIDVVTGMQPEDLFPPGKFVQDWRNYYQRAIREGPYTIEYVTFAEPQTLLLNFNNLEREGAIYGVSVFGKDITEQKKAVEEIQHLAFFDPLTQLPNRRLLQDRLQQALASSTHSGRQGALLLIDLDNFKTLNETLGHDIGDRLLQQVAERLKSCVREGDTVARIGGDEFLVMLEELSKDTLEAAAQAEEVGNKILNLLNLPYQLASREYLSSTSIGVTLFVSHQQSSDQLLSQADIAMYQSKEAGRNTLRFFDPKMQALITARVELEAGLREGLLNDQFIVYYQPLVDSRGKIAGAEALVRWLHPVLGIVPPAEFIPAAEDTGLILPLGLRVLTMACSCLEKWASSPEMAHLTIAVNVSAHQFHQDDFVEQVLEVLNRTGANPQRLKLELTESMLLSNIDSVIAKMDTLKSRGVGFSLDDFGTGYSSLYYLSRLPLDQLKIDRSFVMNIELNDNSVVLCAATISLAHSLKLKVVAEGVENEAQSYFLSSVHHCDFQQGYLFGRPQPPEEFEKAVKRNSENMKH